MRLDWRKIWREFDIWLDKKDNGRDFPEWSAQARKINQLVIEQLNEQRPQARDTCWLKPTPKLNWKKIWRTLNKRIKDYISTLPDWSVQKRWIREIVNKDLEYAIKTNIN